MTGLACAVGDMIGASACGTTLYEPGSRNTVNWPEASDWNCAIRRPDRSTVNVAPNGASHGTSTRQTGVIGPRTTTPVSPVVGDRPADAQPASSAVEITSNTF